MTARIVLACFLAYAVSAQNTIVMGPGYQRDQTSAAPLTLSIPKGWVRDEQAAKKAGLFAVLLPDGATLDSTRRVVTIAFQKKDASVPQLATLDAFFRADLANTRAQFPNVQSARWQPSKLDPLKLNFRSLEMFGDKTSPHRIVMIETVDGFFSVTLTVETRGDLHAAEYEEFFNSLKLP